MQVREEEGSERDLERSDIESQHDTAGGNMPVEEYRPSIYDTIKALQEGKVNFLFMLRKIFLA